MGQGVAQGGEVVRRALNEATNGLAHGREQRAVVGTLRRNGRGQPYHALGMSASRCDVTHGPQAA